MAGLFDDKGFKVQPMMGKRARNKLNKHGFYRMPPNLKGLPAQSEGGLGGAISKGRKQRKFAEGGLAKMTPMDITGQITQWEDAPEMASEDEFAGGEFATDDSGDVDGLAGGVSKNYSPDDLRERMALGRQKIANAYQNYMTQAQQTLQGMQTPKDTSWLAFAANMGKPKYGGGFAADLRNALGGFQGAQNDYQKQLQDFNATRARLGLDVASVPLQQEYKLAEMEARELAENQRRQDLKDYRDSMIALKEQRQNAPKEAKTLPPNTVEKLVKKSETLDQLKNLNSSFKPEFGGFVSDKAGDTAAWLASRGEGKDDISSWWRGYNDYAQYVRHELYGSAFTATEQKAWDATNITPGMNPEKIKENLDRRQKIIDSGLKRQIKTLEKAGYQTEGLEESLNIAEEKEGDQPTSVVNIKEFDDLPNPAEFKGRILKNPETGQRMISDGVNWAEAP